CGQNLRPKGLRRQSMYTYDEKLRAINLYFKYESYAASLNELGYPSRGALRKWVYEFERNGDMKKALTRRSKYSLEQKQEAVNHYLEYGKCYSRTCRVLGYPSRALLTQWVMEMTSELSQFKRNGIHLTSEEKEAGVVALVTRETSAQKVADEIGVSRAALYKYKDQLLGKRVAIDKMEKTTEVDVNKLKQQVKQLQDDIYYLQMEKDILEKAGALIKKDQSINLAALTHQEKTILIDALRPKFKLTELLKFIHIPKSSYCYHSRRLSLPDKYSYIRTQIINIFEKNKRRYGYRRIHASLKKMDVIVSEKIVRRIMSEEDLRVKSIKIRKYRSYDGEISPAVHKL